MFRSPYSVASKTAGCSPYYMGSGVTNASDEEKRRIMHNENERKRKEKLNKWIVRLCTLVPDCNGKNLSKNCILEKTVEFIKKLTKQQKLPDDVQALKDEVIRLTEKVELLSSENTQYLSLLKEAQNLSRGAWSLNMSIQKRQSTDSSEAEDSGITMTPTADKVNLASSGMCKTSSTPCLPVSIFLIDLLNLKLVISQMVYMMNISIFRWLYYLSHFVLAQNMVAKMLDHIAKILF